MILVGLSSYEDKRCPHMRTNRGRIDTRSMLFTINSREAMWSTIQPPIDFMIQKNPRRHSCCELLSLYLEENSYEFIPPENFIHYRLCC